MPLDDDEIDSLIEVLNKKRKSQGKAPVTTAEEKEIAGMSESTAQALLKELRAKKGEGESKKSPSIFDSLFGGK